MALQTTGAISLGDVEDEHGGSAPTSISEYYSADTGVPASGEISLSDFYGTSAVSRVTINLTISSNTNNYNIYTQASADPTYDAGNTDVILTVNARLASTSTSNPALDTGVFASGDTIKLVNNNRIMGKGGLGGAGGGASSQNDLNQSAASGANGGNGGTAIKLQFPITIDNQDRINGGAGGGGGGGGAAARSVVGKSSYHPASGGGGGGGGAGRTQSAGGAGGNAESAGTAGSNSTQLNGGAGGAGGSLTQSSAVTNGGDGGAGGNQGANGSNGASGTASGNSNTATGSGGTGGAAGKAIALNGHSVTYITTGTINGAVS